MLTGFLIIRENRIAEKCKLVAANLFAVSNFPYGIGNDQKS